MTGRKRKAKLQATVRTEEEMIAELSEKAHHMSSTSHKRRTILNMIIVRRKKLQDTQLPRVSDGRYFKSSNGEQKGVAFKALISEALVNAGRIDFVGINQAYSLSTRLVIRNTKVE